MPIKVNPLEQTILENTVATIDRYPVADKPIRCVSPNNKKNPFINFFKMPIKVNSLEQTAET